MIKIFNFQFSIFNFIKHPLFSGSMILVIGSNSVSFLNYLYHFVMGRMLGPSSYGELVVLISVIGFLGIIPGSLSMVIIKYISSAKNQDEIAILTNWLKDRSFKVALGLFILIVIISPFIISFLHINQLWYMLLVAATYFFSIPSLVNKSVLQGLLKFKEMMFAVLAENLAKLVLAVLLVYVGFAIGGVMVSLAVASVVGWYISKIYLKDFKRQRNPNLSDIRPMLLFAIPVMIQSFSVTSLISSDLILVKHFFSAHDAGIYSAISTLGKIIFFGAGPIGAVIFPMVAGKQSKGEDYRRVFIYSLAATFFLALGLLSIYWLFPSLIITMLYNSSYLEGKNLLFWFGLSMSLFTVSSLLISYSLSLGKTKVVIFPLVAASLQIILIWFYHYSLFSVISVSISVIALLLVSLLIYLSFGKESLWK